MVARTVMASWRGGRCARDFGDQRAHRACIARIRACRSRLPVGLFQAPGDNSRWFVIEQGGIVSQFPNTPNPAATTLVLDITDRVECCGEADLLGLAFHPSFPATPLAYVSYTRVGPNPQIPLISYISGVPDERTADRRSTRVRASAAHAATAVLESQRRQHRASDRTAISYIGFGDGGSGGDPQNHAQNVQDLLGSILRIDVNVTPPARSTPYRPRIRSPRTPSCTGGCPEIYAWGMRNPWRWSFDTATGKLWAGDVGQDNWEEIDIIENGKELRLALLRGSRWPTTPAVADRRATYTFPIAVYSH